MELLSPSWLYLTAIAAPVIALYLFKPKRREQKVPTTIFWRQILRERSERPSIRRLRQFLSLLLLLLFLAASALAAGRPFWGKVPAGRDAVIIIDTSASMGVMEGGKTRLELAKEEARALLRSLPAGAQAALITLGPSPAIAVSRTQDVPLLLRGVDSLSSTSGSSNMQGALELAADLALGQKPPATVYLISDGGGLPEMESRNYGIPITYIPVGEAEENVGITAFVIRRHPTADRDYEILLTVHNDSPQGVSLKVELSLDGNLLNAIPMTIEAKGDRTEVFSQTLLGSGVLRAKVVNTDPEAVDLLPDDDEAFAYVPDRPSAQVALVSESGAYFLKAALLSNPTIEAFEVAPFEWMQATQSEYDLVIFHQHIPEELPKIPYLIFDGTPGPGEPLGPASAPTSGPVEPLPASEPGEGVSHGPVVVVGEDGAPKIGVVDYRHPLLSHVGIDGIHLAEARIVERPDWGKVVIDGQRGPLLIAGERDGVRAIYAAFDPNDSDLPFRVGFLNLMANAVNWLWGVGADPNDYAVVPGSPAPALVFAREDISTLSVSPAEKEDDPGEPIRSFRVKKPGVYDIKANGEYVATFVASLTDNRESRIAPVKALGLGEQPYQQISGTLASLGRDLWWPVALLGLLLVALEWFLYRRRIVQ